MGSNDGQGGVRNMIRLLDDTGAVHEHAMVPGGVCPACSRLVPREPADAATRHAREIMSVSTPRGEEGVLDGMLMQLVEKYADAWPEDARAARANVGLALVGERSWRYRALHFAVYAALNVPGLEPTEEGA